MARRTGRRARRAGADVAIHGEDGVGDDDRRIGRGPGLGSVPVGRQQLLEVVQVTVAVDGEGGTREPAAVDDAGVVQLVREHTDARGHRACRARPRLAANPVGKQTAASVPFQSARASSSSLWMGRRPGHQARGARSGAPALQRLVGRRHDGRMGAQAEIVVGRERDDRRPIRGARRSAGVELPGRAPAALVDHPGERVTDPGVPGTPAHAPRAGSAGPAGSAGSAATSSSAPSSASTIRTISSAVIVSGGISTTTSPERSQQHAPGYGTGAHPPPPPQPRRGRGQLDPDHQAALANGAHDGPTGDPFSQQRRQLVGTRPNVGQHVPRLDQHAGARAPPPPPTHSRRTNARGRRSRARGRRRGTRRRRSPDATVADMARYPPVIPLPRHSRSGRRPHCSEANSVPVRPNPVATSSQIKRMPA